MNKFWNFLNKPTEATGGNGGVGIGNADNGANGNVTERDLYIDGVIAEESWFEDDVTPKAFKDELCAGKGDITVYINSPGGDCIAASRIYTMLTEYEGKVTVKIDGLAASAASVIAMSGDEVLMSPTSLLMVHNPATLAWGDSAEMLRVKAVLDEVKESIINAYAKKTQMSRNKLAKLMDEETWLSANKAIELGFADGLIERANGAEKSLSNYSFSRLTVTNSIVGKMKPTEPPVPPITGNDAKPLYERLLNVTQKF